MTQPLNNLAANIWLLANLLHGCFKQSEYGRIILPFTLLRRLECVLEESKEKVLAEHEKILTMNLSEEAQEKLLLLTNGGLSFFNISKMDLSKLGESGIKSNLESYIQGFSKDARDIFEHFKFAEFIGQLNDANLLYKIVQKVRQTDLSLKAISNYEMGLVFEELIRRSVEGSNETAGEHFTPRDIIRLTTSLVFMEDDDALTKPGIIRTIYDPTAGTGGFLSSGMEYVHELNPQAVMRAFGQELNQESYAICKADMLIKGQDVSNIKLGNTLSNDQLYANKFDYMLSNPPFGVDWKKIEQDIKDEHTLKGFDGRFGPGLPRVSDGSLLFLLHLISKLKDKAEGGGRISVLVNSSPLRTGDAGSGESEIRRYLVERDLLETIIALPEGMHYNTGVQTYILVLSNNKKEIRKNKVKLIDARKMGLRMRKRVGSKINYFDEDSIARILELYAVEKNTEHSKYFSHREFGYRKVKLKLTDKTIDYERVPLDRNIKEYLKDSLEGVYSDYQIDTSFVDHKDGRAGMVGYEFPVDCISTKKAGKQFRFYFDEVESDDDWLFYISMANGKVTFRSDDASIKSKKGNHYYFKNRDTRAFALDYLKHFFESNKWKEWVATYNPNGTLIGFSKYDLVRRGIQFPSVDEQRYIVEVINGVNRWRDKLSSLEHEIWSKDSGSFQLDKYKLPVDRDLLERIVEISPFPFANIIHHYQNISQEDYKARYELLLKLFECLAVFLTAVLIGCIGDEEQLRQTILNEQKRFLKNATFGVWSKILGAIFKKLKSTENERNSSFVEKILDDRTLSLFEQAVDIRNQTSGHGSYPTKTAARETLTAVQQLFDEFMETLYGMFEQYTLVRPLSGTWDKKFFTYQVEEFKGLGCYPFGLKKIKTESPFVDGELYLVSDQNDEKIKLYPFIRLIDIEEDSGLEAFYFYSKMLEEIEEKSSSSPKEFLYISHQQINRQSKTYSNDRISSIFC